MKHRKQLAAIALALTVFFSLGVNAYAEETPAPTTEETTQVEIEQSTSIPEEVTPPAVVNTVFMQLGLSLILIRQIITLFPCV